MTEQDNHTSESHDKCVNCGKPNLTKFENDVIVCVDCGFAATSNTRDYTSRGTTEHREKDYPEAFVRSLTPPKIRFTPVDNPIGADLHGQKRIVEMWWENVNITDATEKNLALAFSEITKIGDTLSLPKNALEKAAATYKEIVDKRCLKGRNIRTLSAATVYLACKQCGRPRTLNDVAIASNLSKRKVRRSYRFIVKELGCFIPPEKPKMYLPEFLGRLSVSEKTRTTIGKILQVAEEIKLLSGRKPMSIVAAATYIASLITGEKKTQRRIAEVAHVTEATIRNRYKELIEGTVLVVSL